MDLNLTPAQLINARSLDAARLVSAKFFSKKDGGSVLEAFRQRHPYSMSASTIEKHFTKAAVPAAGPDSWGAQLATSDPADLVGGLIAFAEPFSILPRAGLRRAPFHTNIVADSFDDNSAVYWRRGPGSIKVLIEGNFDRTILLPRSVAAITVVTEELLRFGRPGSEEYLRGLLARALVRFVDRFAFDPSNGPASESQPASLTFGVTPTTATGQPRDDINALIADYIAAGGRLESATIVLSSANAVAFRTLDPEVFRDLTIRGGSIVGVPAIAGAGAGNVVALIDVSRVLYGDDSQGRIDVSTQGTLEMVDTSVSPAASTQVSLFQSNAAAILFERYVNWENRGGGVAFLERDYLTSGSPS